MVSLFPTIIAVFLFLFMATVAESQEWAAQKSPLTTRWAKDVNPKNPLPEYPRPQMVRKEWMNLNGLWDFEVIWFTSNTSSGKILVPFPIESALSGVMKPVKPEEILVYRKSIVLPQRYVGKSLLLHIGALDYQCTVTVTGGPYDFHTGGYDPISLFIPSLETWKGELEITVNVTDSTGNFQPRGKQFLKPEGIWYTPVTGIWQTVWIEPVPESYIESLDIVPDLDNSTLKVGAKVKGQDTDLSVRVTASEKGSVVAKGSGKPGAKLDLKLDNPKLWSPETPFLYDLKIELLEAGKVIDSVTSYAAMRKIEVSKDSKGIPRIKLNGKEVFCIGPLDQGFWPDGIYTAPTDEALKFDIVETKKLGFNTIRKHVKVEPDRWYYWCDKLGMMVWQDMPSPHFSDSVKPETLSTNDKNQFLLELKAMIDALKNHPCIVMWVPFNEGWGQHDTVSVVEKVRQWDPTRLINNASGWTDMKSGNVMDIHVYPGPGIPPLETKRAAVLGEFGGLGLGVDGHTWTDKAWGYQGMADKDSLTKKYVDLLRQTYQLKDRGLCAAIYTQTTDVETECNGFFTYDREVFKFNLKDFLNANKGIFPKEIPFVWVLPSAQFTIRPGRYSGPPQDFETARWAYTMEAPKNSWMNSGFDDSHWYKGAGGFGTLGTPNTMVFTTWNTSEIWLRKTFELATTKFKNLRLRMHHDEDAEVYINGILACKVAGYTTEYQDFPISKEALATLKKGKNLIAVYCKQTSGGQYIDLGLVGDE